VRSKEAILSDFDNPDGAVITYLNLDSRTHTVRNRVLLETLLDLRDGVKATHSGEPVTIITVTTTKTGTTTTHTVFYYDAAGTLGTDTNLANFTIG